MATTSLISSLSDPASISSNRAGQFSPWQRQVLKPPSLLGTQIVLMFFSTFRFRVSLPAYNALVTGERYRVYYLPKTKRLVSIEPLP